MPQCPESRPTGDLATDPAAQKEYEMLKVLAEHYFGSMMVVDAAGRFVYANPGCSKLLDIDHDTLMRISIYDTLQDYCCSSSASSIKTLETRQECLSNQTLTSSGRRGPCPGLTSARTGSCSTSPPTAGTRRSCTPCWRSSTGSGTMSATSSASCRPQTRPRT